MSEASLAEAFLDRRILVVGGAGFVGSNLVHALLNANAREVLVIDNLLSSERANLPDRPNLTFREGSIADDRILNDLRDDFEYVFHLATFHGNQNSIHDPLADHENGMLTTLMLYERIRGFTGINQVVYASAGCTVAERTFGKATATTEDAPVSLYLDSPYQISKIIGEFYSNYYFQQHALPVIKARFQNVYGPGEILGAGRWRGTPSTIWRNVVPSFIYRSLRRMPLTVENRGVATRDFIYIDDIIRGLMLCAARGTAGAVYNLASGVETSILELARMVDGLTGNRTQIESLPAREWDRSGARFGSTEKAKRELGFEAETELSAGLETTIDWTRKNLEFIEACMRKHGDDSQSAT